MKKTIKDAVIQFGGVWPEFSWKESKQNKHAIVKTIKQWEDEEGKIYHKGHIGKGGASLDSDFCELVCTKSEFEAEAKRMGYINGYKFMQEYTEKGKPNLPDDVMVSVMTHNRGRLPAGHVGFWNWNSSEIKSFRIVDERYKPVSEISEGKPDAVVVSEKPESNWFERGELPPVGELCEFRIALSKEYSKCTFVGINSSRNFVIEVYGKYSSYHESQIEFRPIRTEREKFIDDVEAAFKAAEPDKLADWGFLYDAGFRGPKVEK